MKIEQAGSQNAVLFAVQGQKTQIPKKGIESADVDALPVSEQFLIKSIEKANKAVMGANTCFEFSIHEKTKEIVVKVLNADTGELIREIPSEKILDIVAGIWQAVGLFVDERM